MAVGSFVAQVMAWARPGQRGRKRDTLAEMAEFPDMNPGPVFRLDLDGIVLRANVAARRVFRNDDLLAACWSDICPGMTAELWSQALESADPLNHETLIHDRCFVFTHARRPGGEHVFVYGSDITERRQVEQILARQARELAEMARFPEMNPGAVCRLDREGTVVLANAAARGLFGEPNLVGKCWLDVCPQMTPAFWDRALASTKHVTHETQVGERWVVFTHTPGDGEREIFVYGADLTEQRDAERALSQSEKMATLGTLAAGVAHELNNPAAAAQRAAEHLRDEFTKLQAAQIKLSAVPLSGDERDGLVALDGRARSQALCACDLDAVSRSDHEAAIEEWLESRGVDDAWELASPLVDFGLTVEGLHELESQFQPQHVSAVVTWLSHAYPVYRLLNEIHHGAGRLSEIVGALKDYSYVGQAPIQAVDINEGVHNTLVILHNKLKRGVTVVRELADDLPRIQAYGGDLNQVWTNLIDNAVDAMNGEGQLTLRTTGDGEWVIVEVEDDGPGIPREQQSRIYDAFFTTKPPGHGTGLGLHTCYNIVVKKHGGSIDLDSRPGKTRFVVRLPIEGPSPATT